MTSSCLSSVCPSLVLNDDIINDDIVWSVLLSYKNWKWWHHHWWHHHWKHQFFCLSLVQKIPESLSFVHQIVRNDDIIIDERSVSRPSVRRYIINYRLYQPPHMPYIVRTSFISFHIHVRTRKIRFYSLSTSGRPTIPRHAGILTFHHFHCKIHTLSSVPTTTHAISR